MLLEKDWTCCKASEKIIFKILLSTNLICIVLHFLNNSNSFSLSLSLWNGNLHLVKLFFSRGTFRKGQLVQKTSHDITVIISRPTNMKQSLAPNLKVNRRVTSYCNLSCNFNLNSPFCFYFSTCNFLFIKRSWTNWPCQYNPHLFHPPSPGCHYCLNKMYQPRTGNI